MSSAPPTWCAPPLTRYRTELRPHSIREQLRPWRLSGSARNSSVPLRKEGVQATSISRPGHASHYIAEARSGRLHLMRVLPERSLWDWAQEIAREHHESSVLVLVELLKAIERNE